MTVLHSLEELSTLSGPVALAIGVFDGLHLGHQEVIRAALEHAHQHQGTAVVMSFEPHPLAILRPEAVPPRLCGPAYRRLLLERLGVGCMLLCPFDENTATTPAQMFLDTLTRDCRPLGCVSVGYGWTFGRNRGGDIHLLMAHGERDGFAVYGVPPVRVDGQVVSSTLIRDAVSAGELGRANRLLGRDYALYGEVLPGRRLARQLGFPTANVRPEAELLPPYGVYGVQVELEGRNWAGVANLGVRPTVETGDAAPSLEVHLFDWSDDLYGRSLEVRLGDFIRPEQKFPGVEALKKQVEADVILARGLAEARAGGKNGC
jgi:riboflavin kinase/FMN adenylyltransferase